MKRFLSQMGLVCLAMIMAISANAQTAGAITGTVKNSATSETLTAVTITVKGGNAGTYTDDKGNFKLVTTQKAPFTLVFSSVGYASKEVAVDANTSSLSVSLTPSYTLGSDVVVSASRVAERILESPVSIERVSSAQIKTAAATNYYDLLANLKGVDVVAASLTFKSISTRGFNGSGNNRLNQLIDGMDNQAPGLNFSVGTITGLTELDVDNMELLPGASSALYGSGGMNGTILINSKNPFKYQGLSFQIKQGVNHVDNYQRPQAAYKDYSVRFASKVGDRWAYKIATQYTEAQDWLAKNDQNYSRTTGTANGQVIPGNRYSDFNYDGVNIYGDETTSSLSSVFNSVKAGVLGALTAAYGGNATAANAAYGQLYGAAVAGPYSVNLTTYSAFLRGANAALAPYAPYLFGEARGLFTGVNVSRTGYAESDIINPVAKNFKVTGSIHYKIDDKTEASFSAYTGSGNTVYTGSDRYSIYGLGLSQFKLEVKSKNWMIRGYKTLENSGESYNATITARYFNELVKPSTTWYPTYTAAFVTYRDAGMNLLDAGAAARAVADAGRPTGRIGESDLFKSVAGIPISKGGGRFLDKSQLTVVEANYNLTELFGLDKYNADLLVGGIIKNYALNSQGTLFADTAGKIGINESGAYAQLSKRYFDDIELAELVAIEARNKFHGEFARHN